MYEGASPLFQAVVPSALRPEHVRLQSSATDCEPCLTPAHTKDSIYSIKRVTNNAVRLCGVGQAHTEMFIYEYYKSSTHIEE